MRERCLGKGVLARWGWAGETIDYCGFQLIKHHCFSAIDQHPPFNMATHSPGQDNLF
jgi:hypothetical protein